MSHSLCYDFYMTSLLLRWLISALALLLTAYVVPGIMVASFYTAMIVALVIGIINVTLKPLLVLLTLPINILTLGLFTLVINGLLFWFASSIIKGFSVSDFWVALLGALLFSVITTIANHYL